MGTPNIPSSDTHRNITAELAESARRAALIQEGAHHVGTVKERIQESIVRMQGYTVPEVQDIETIGK